MSGGMKLWLAVLVVADNTEAGHLGFEGGKIDGNRAGSAGTFLAIRSKDRMGVVGAIASICDTHNVLISSFEFSHSAAQKRSMFLIRTPKDVADEVVDEFRKQEHITLVRRIRI